MADVLVCHGPEWLAYENVRQPQKLVDPRLRGGDSEIGGQCPPYIYVFPVVKRIVDILGSGIGIVLLSPVMLAIAVLIRLTMGRPVLFRQTRPGLRSRPFTLYKFRTMHEFFDAQKRPLPDEERMTALGRFLRSTSLDELPELFNVLKGDMSLVGPRPLLVEYLDRYTPEQARRHDVRPGVTGWAQVKGRNALTWEEKFTLDVWYVDHVSQRLDLWILLLTVLKVFTREGVSQPGRATVDYFQGSANNHNRADSKVS